MYNVLLYIKPRKKDQAYCSGFQISSLLLNVQCFVHFFTILVPIL